MVVTVVRWTGREARALRQALRLSVRSFANHTGLGTTTIVDLEAKGAQAQLRHATQQLLDDALAAAPDEVRQRFCALAGDTVLHTDRAGADSDAAVGLVPGQLRVASGMEQPHTISKGVPGREVELTNRRHLIASVAGATVGAWLPDAARPRSTTTTVVDRGPLADLSDVADALAAMYRTVDPRPVLAMAAAYADDLLELYERHASYRSLEAAELVVGLHCQVGLWACHSHQAAQARRYLATGCEIAASVDDPSLQARAWGALSYLYSSAPRGGAGGDPARALHLLTRALALVPASDAFTCGWLATWRADQHATLGDPAAARRDVDLAQASLDAGGHGPQRGFFARRHYGYGMHGHLNSVRGLVHALAGDLDESQRTFHTVQQHAANSRRRIASHGHHALAFTHAAQPEAACQELHHSITLAAADPYPMGLARARGVRAGFDPAWTGLPCVRDLDQHLATLTPTGA